MDYDDAVKDLKNIQSTMEKATIQASRERGWFFLIQGAVWLSGFLVTQFVPSIAGPLWIALNVIAVAAIVAVSMSLYGKKGRQRHPGLALRIILISVGIVAFDFVLAFSFGLTAPGSFTLLLILSMGFCYFIIGLSTLRSMSFLGAFTTLSVFAARLLFPSYLYLSIAILAGGGFIAYGAGVLLYKGRADA
jgi:hypothetical protein